jgi:polysaccharide biosynthesis transport protein
LPALGIVPSLQSMGGRYGYLAGSLKPGAQSKALVRQRPEMVSLTASSSIIAEAYRSLRTALLLSTPGSPPKTIMVTSPKAKEGKTTTVCNLALSLAQSGKSVVIVDCDLRRPRIRKIFSQNGHRGLSEYLTGQLSLDEIIETSEVPNLCIVNAGTVPPNPCELLGSERMSEAIEVLRETFDLVLIDTPPLMSVTDPLMLAPLVDGVVLVTHGGKSPPEILDKARRSLEMVRSRVLGVVINNVNIHSGDYTYYYRDFYDYESYVKKV